jgi:excisionase family DNA binding protein
MAPVSVTPEPLVDSINDTAVRLGLSRTTLYELISSGQLRSIKLGKRRLIPRDAQRELLESRSAARNPVSRKLGDAHS